MTIITISRGTFGGGKMVAEALAQQLGIACISREEIIQDASRAYNVLPSDLRDAVLEEPGILGLNEPAKSHNIKLVRTALLQKAKDGNAIYHGYGGHLLLKNIPNILRVRIIAGMEYRVTQVMKQQSISRKAAEQFIRQNDDKRIKWARNMWGADWHDASQFDMVLNLDHITVQHCVTLIREAARLPEFTQDDTSRRILADQLIESRIWVGLIKNKYTRNVRVAIDTVDGSVTIKGTVGSVKLADAVCGIAHESPGVRQVNNELNVGSDWLW